MFKLKEKNMTIYCFVTSLYPGNTSHVNMLVKIR